LRDLKDQVKDARTNVKRGLDSLAKNQAESYITDARNRYKVFDKTAVNPEQPLPEYPVDWPAEQRSRWVCYIRDIQGYP
jgi:hypothetical protein